MVVFDCKFALGCGPERIIPKYIYFNVRTLVGTDAITNEVLAPITFVITYPTVQQI